MFIYKTIILVITSKLFDCALSNKSHSYEGSAKGLQSIDYAPLFAVAFPFCSRVLTEVRIRITGAWDKSTCLQYNVFKGKEPSITWGPFDPILSNWNFVTPRLPSFCMRASAGSGNRESY